MVYFFIEQKAYKVVEQLFIRFHLGKQTLYIGFFCLYFKKIHFFRIPHFDHLLGRRLKDFNVFMDDFHMRYGSIQQPHVVKAFFELIGFLFLHFFFVECFEFCHCFHYTCVTAYFKTGKKWDLIFELRLKEISASRVVQVIRCCI